MPTNLSSVPFLKELSRILRKDQCSVTEPDRLSYGRDCNSQSILWARRGLIKYPPQVVVWPENTAEVSKVMAFANGRKIPVIPFGGGSGVCGGTWALRGGIALDMKRMDSFLGIDSKKQRVRAQVGINGEILERELQRKGFTLGHFPSSIYVATLGGYLACRSAGQLSSLYGKIEDMIESMEVVLADGRVLKISEVSQSPGVMDWKELFMGSEGTMGVITEATLRIHPKAESERWLSFTFPSLKHGLEAARTVMQSGLKPAVVRLYDELDSLLASSHQEEDGSEAWGEWIKEILGPVKGWVKDTALKIALQKSSLMRKGVALLPGRCLFILGFEGSPLLLESQAKLAERLCQEQQGKSLGEAPGLHWKKHRYSVSYKLSPLFDKGCLADTMEVATTWKNLVPLYKKIRMAMAPHGLVLAHFSHAYPEGCSIYFTFVAYRKDEDDLEKLYQQIWDDGLKACVGAGGTISHHHGIGLLKAAYMSQEWGESLGWLKKVKRALDPNGILNPGKLGLSDK